MGSAAFTRPASGVPPRRVVLIGIVGLRWSDVSAAATPALWRLANKGAVGSLLVSEGYRPGLIGAASTHQPGTTVITDLTPTVLHWLPPSVS